MSPRLTESEVRAFEQQRGIRIPNDHRAFLLHIGEGGAGPYCGLGPLMRWVDLSEKPEVAEKALLGAPHAQHAQHALEQTTIESVLLGRALAVEFFEHLPWVGTPRILVRGEGTIATPVGHRQIFDVGGGERPHRQNEEGRAEPRRSSPSHGEL